MKVFFQNKGFTLVELLVSMALLTIIIIAFTSFFGWNTINIFANGQKSEAVAKAETKLERLYSNGKTYFSTSAYVSDPQYVDSNIYHYDQSREEKYRDLNFHVRDVTYDNGEIKGYVVAVVVFYQNAERQVSISSFIKPNEEGGHK